MDDFPEKTGPRTKNLMPNSTLQQCYVRAVLLQSCRVLNIRSKGSLKSLKWFFAEVQNFTVGGDVNGTKENRAKLDFC